MARATYEGLERLRPNARPFVITRAGYAGVQRYSTMWIGDTNATFDALALSIPMYASLGLSGEAFVGGDLPGFMGRGDGELLARSYEVATFVPLCRNHGVINDYDHEPWRYGAPYEDIVRKYLQLRYRLMPFLYTTLEEAHRTGVPLFRPVILNFQEDVTAANLDDEFMAGDVFLAAPVVRAGARSRDVYLPKGRWYEFWNDEVVAGGDRLVHADAPLDRMPLYVRGGSIVPSTIAMAHTGEKPWNPIQFDIYPDEANAAAGSLYEDDGQTPSYQQGVYRRTDVTWAKGELRVAADGSYSPPPRDFAFVVHGFPRPGGVEIDGQPATGLTTDARGVTTLRLRDDGKPHILRLK
jgi:alpha-glucosidase